jgi:hypothetical protein
MLTRKCTKSISSFKHYILQGSELQKYTARTILCSGTKKFNFHFERVHSLEQKPDPCCDVLQLFSERTNILKTTVLRAVLPCGLTDAHRFWKKLLPPSSGYVPDVGCAFHRTPVSTNHTAAHLKKLFVISRSCVFLH